MITKLQSLPPFFRSEASPKVQNSAFPPFKIEHRYKGVYERAGFDVNLSGIDTESRNLSVSGGGYLTPPKSASPSASKSFTTSENMVQNDSGRQKKLGKSENKSAIELKKEAPNFYNMMPSSATSLPALQDHKDNGGPYKSAPYTSGGRMPYESDNNIVLRQNTFDSSKYDENIRSVKAPDHQMNHKNLRLDLGVSPSGSENAYESIPPESDNDSSINNRGASSNLHNHISPVKSSNVFEKNIEKNETPYPESDTVPQQPFNQKGSEIVELDDEQQFDFNSPFQQQGRFESNTIHQEVEANNTSNGVKSEIHQDDESPKIPPRNEQRIAYDSPAALSIFVSRFDSFIKNSEMNSRGSVDSGMLNPNGNNGYDDLVKNPQRVSNLSMVSSIISKESEYEDDDEIEKELERQLESLKVGGSAGDNNVSEYPNHSEAIANNNVQSIIPIINIENIDHSKTLDYTTPNSSFHSVNTSEFVSVNNLQTIDDPQDETHSTFSFETVEPLAIRQNDTSSTENSTNYMELSNGAYYSNDNNVRPLSNSDKHLSSSTVHTRTLIQEDDDFVKPLSPKTHHVEKELRDIGMRDLNESSNTLHNFEEGNSAVQEINNQNILPSKESFCDTLGHNNTAESYVVTPAPISSGNETEARKYLPGEGPCRSCNLEINSSGKGSQRAIHSKSGELSGQWHRGCFHCNYHGCKILFNKNVQCYVLNDMPLCRQHYHERNNTICESCKHGIEGECVVNELEQKWHLNCLLCYSCHNSINSDYYLINGLVFCEKDAEDIINGKQTYGESNGLTSKDKIEKRRTRLLYVE